MKWCFELGLSDMVEFSELGCESGWANKRDKKRRWRVSHERDDPCGYCPLSCCSLSLSLSLSPHTTQGGTVKSFGLWKQTAQLMRANLSEGSWNTDQSHSLATWPTAVAFPTEDTLYSQQQTIRNSISIAQLRPAFRFTIFNLISRLNLNLFGTAETLLLLHFLAKINCFPAKSAQIGQKWTLFLQPKQHMRSWRAKNVWLT